MKKGLAAVTITVILSITAATPAMAVEPQTASSVVIPEDQQPDFTSCININPLEFKWDWGCVIKSLFMPSAGSQQQFTESVTTLQDTFPFYYIPFVMELAQSFGGYTNSKVCKETSVVAMGQTMTILPCNKAVAESTRVLTGWGFSIFILIAVGTYVIRQLIPRLPGDD